MLTEYETKTGPRKQFHKFVTLNMKKHMYNDVVRISNKNEETMSDFMRRSIQKEVERNT